VRLALFGHGRMGRATETIAIERGHEVSCILDELSNEGGEGITRPALDGAHVAIDFSVAAAVHDNVCHAAELGVSVVVGTTGWEKEKEAVEAIARGAEIGLLTAPNFSVGMLLFMRVIRFASRLANQVDEYDVHLAETHHRHKADHPGGTARRLATIVLEELERKSGWTAELPDGAPLDPGRLHLSISRVGSVPGVHSMALEGPDDRIELRHEARSRVGFARGAVLAAEWLEGRSGIFSMEDVMADLLGRHLS
jgi:4-hydroxy-tetrahydrodipicolinate reductase